MKWIDKKKIIIEKLKEYGYVENTYDTLTKEVEDSPMVAVVNLKMQPKPGEHIPIYFVDPMNLDEGELYRDINGVLESTKQIIRNAINTKEEPTPEPEQTEQPEQTSNVPVIKNIENIDVSGPDKLTVDIIQNYINPNATVEEAFQFLQLCKSQGLNPFVGEAHLIKYGGKATFVVGKDAHLRRAEEQNSFDGFKAGIIVENKDGINEKREGSFLTTKNEILLGGWAEVYRKDIKLHFVSKVSLEEYIGRKSDGTTSKMWVSKPATMIRKVALVQALREAYVGLLEGMYDVCEMNDIGDVEAIE